LQYAANLSSEAIVVILLPDSGRSYLSTLYNDKWRADKGL